MLHLPHPHRCPACGGPHTEGAVPTLSQQVAPYFGTFIAIQPDTVYTGSLAVSDNSLLVINIPGPGLYEVTVWCDGQFTRTSSSSGGTGVALTAGGVVSGTKFWGGDTLNPSPMTANASLVAFAGEVTISGLNSVSAQMGASAWLTAWNVTMHIRARFVPTQAHPHL